MADDRASQPAGTQGETPEPLALFEAWFEKARTSETGDPTAMALATVDGQGRPSSRMVLLKGADARGFVFYTNLDSRKGQDLLARPWAALLFYWKSLGRQVRVEGAVERVSTAEALSAIAQRARNCARASARIPDALVGLHVSNRAQHRRRVVG